MVASWVSTLRWNQSTASNKLPFIPAKRDSLILCFADSNWLVWFVLESGRLLWHRSRSAKLDRASCADWFTTWNGRKLYVRINMTIKLRPSVLVFFVFRTTDITFVTKKLSKIQYIMKFLRQKISWQKWLPRKRASCVLSQSYEQKYVTKKF